MLINGGILQLFPKIPSKKSVYVLHPRITSKISGTPQTSPNTPNSLIPKNPQKQSHFHPLLTPQLNHNNTPSLSITPSLTLSNSNKITLPYPFFTFSAKSTPYFTIPLYWIFMYFHLYLYIVKYRKIIIKYLHLYIEDNQTLKKFSTIKFLFFQIPLKIPKNLTVILR